MNLDNILDSLTADDYESSIVTELVNAYEAEKRKNRKLEDVIKLQRIVIADLKAKR